MRKTLFTDFTLTDAIYRCTCGQTISLGNGQLNPKDGRRIEVVPHGCAKCFDRWLKTRIAKAEMKWVMKQLDKFEIPLGTIENNAVRLGELVVAFRNDVDIKYNVRVGEV